MWSEQLHTSIGNGGPRDIEMKEPLQAPQSVDSMIRDSGSRQIKHLNFLQITNVVECIVRDGAICKIEFTRFREVTQAGKVVLCKVAGMIAIVGLKPSYRMNPSKELVSQYATEDSRARGQLRSPQASCLLPRRCAGSGR